MLAQQYSVNLITYFNQIFCSAAVIGDILVQCYSVTALSIKRLLLFSASCRSPQKLGILLPSLQSSPDVLPEDSRVLAGLRPAQVGAFLYQLPHAVAWRQLPGWDLLQKQQDQHVLLLVKQPEAAAAQDTFPLLFNMDHTNLTRQLQIIIFLNACQSEVASTNPGKDVKENNTVKPSRQDNSSQQGYYSYL